MRNSVLHVLFLLPFTLAASLRGASVAHARHRGLMGLTVDFAGYATGQVVDELEFGITVEAKKFKHRKGSGPMVDAKAMIFDSSNPSGGDVDLGTPHKDFGGPGIGRAGRAGSPVANSISRGKVLILSTDDDSSNPNDHRFGGYVLFNFEVPMIVKEIGLLDNEENTKFDVELADGSTRSILAGQGGDNSYEGIVFGEFGLADVTRLQVTFGGSGAITHLDLEHISGEDGSSVYLTDPIDGFDIDSLGGDSFDLDGYSTPTSTTAKDTHPDASLFDEYFPPVPAVKKTESPPDPLVKPVDPPVDHPPVSGGDKPDELSCGIDYFMLWDAAKNKKMHYIGNNSKICKSKLPSKINIEARTFSCVKRVKFELGGPVQRTHSEGKSPYFLRGDKAGVPYGMDALPCGDYTLGATPNGDRNWYKEISFSIEDC